MKKIERREDGKQVISKYGYDDGKQALEAYVSLTEEQRSEMAVVYQEAFGGHPWYEVFKCNGCEEFTRTDDACSHCGGNSFSEAYPIDWLVNEHSGGFDHPGTRRPNDWFYYRRSHQIRAVD